MLAGALSTAPAALLALVCRHTLCWGYLKGKRGELYRLRSHVLTNTLYKRATTAIAKKNEAGQRRWCEQENKWGRTGNATRQDTCLSDSSSSAASTPRHRTVRAAGPSVNRITGSPRTPGGSSGLDTTQFGTPRQATFTDMLRLPNDEASAAKEAPPSPPPSPPPPWGAKRSSRSTAWRSSSPVLVHGRLGSPVNPPSLGEAQGSASIMIGTRDRGPS